MSSLQEYTIPNILRFYIKDETVIEEASALFTHLSDDDYSDISLWDLDNLIKYIKLYLKNMMKGENGDIQYLSLDIKNYLEEESELLSYISSPELGESLIKALTNYRAVYEVEESSFGYEMFSDKAGNSEDKALIPIGIIKSKEDKPIVHPEYGVCSFSETEYEQLVNNFKNQITGYTPYITWGHIEEDGVNTVNSYFNKVKTRDAEFRRGDVVDITTKGNVIYAECSLDEETARILREGKYRYSSPEIIRSYTNKESPNQKVGAVLTVVSLTNKPFFPFRENQIEMYSDNPNQIYNLKIEDKSMPLTVAEEFNTSAQSQESKTEVVNPEVTPDTVEETPVSLMEVSTEEGVVNEEPAKVGESTKVEFTQTESTEVVEPAKVETTPIESSTPVTLSQPQSITIETPSMPNQVSNIEPTKEEGVTASFSLRDIQSLIDATIAKTAEAYTNQVSQLGDVIQNLKTELKTQKSIIEEQAATLAQTQAVAQQYSDAVTQEQRAARRTRLLEKGLSPAVVKFSEQITDAINSKQAVLKFSDASGDEKQSTLGSAIDELLELTVAQSYSDGQYGAPMSNQELDELNEVASLAPFEQRLLQKTKEMKTAKAK
jgi:hypothetical protein